MIRHTVRSLGRKLEQLSNHRIPMSRSLDLLEERARSVEEAVAIEVMRESYLELASEVGQRAMKSDQADSRARTARMPSMALSR